MTRRTTPAKAVGKRTTSEATKPSARKPVPKNTKKAAPKKAPTPEPLKQELLSNRPIDFVKIEKQLSVLGFFTATTNNAKKIGAKTVKISIPAAEGERFERIEGEVTIRAPHGDHLPTTADQDRFVVFMEMVNDIKRRTGVVENPVTFTSSGMLKALTLTDGDENYSSIEAWLERMAGTTIKSSIGLYHAGRKRWEKAIFHVFDQVKIKGQELENGSVAEENYVWLSQWQLENINNHYQLSIDRDAYLELDSPIAKALVLPLYVWLFASENRGFFAKKYEDLAQFLSITVHKYKSKIERQLEGPLDELVREGWIASWRIQRAKSSEGFVVVFEHGPKYWSDRALARSRRELAPAESEKVVGRATPPKQLDLLPMPDAESYAAEIHARGLDAKVAHELLEGLTADQLGAVGDVLANYDEQQRRGKLRNPPGFLRNELKKLRDATPATKQAPVRAEETPDPTRDVVTYSDPEFAAEIWCEIAATIRAGKPKKAYDDWIAPIVPVGFDARELVLGVPNDTFATYLGRGAVGKELKELARQRELALRFEIVTP